jgi:hypothetical protein
MQTTFVLANPTLYLFESLCELGVIECSLLVANLL